MKILLHLTLKWNEMCGKERAVSHNDRWAWMSTKCDGMWFPWILRRGFNWLMVAGRSCLQDATGLRGHNHGHRCEFVNLLPHWAPSEPRTRPQAMLPRVCVCACVCQNHENLSSLRHNGLSSVHWCTLNVEWQDTSKINHLMEVCVRASPFSSFHASFRCSADVKAQISVCEPTQSEMIKSMSALFQ